MSYFKKSREIHKNAFLQEPPFNDSDLQPSNMFKKKESSEGILQ